MAGTGFRMSESFTSETRSIRAASWIVSAPSLPGFQAYVSKPVEPEKLVEAVATVAWYAW